MIFSTSRRGGLGQKVVGRVIVMEKLARIELDLPWALGVLAEKLQGRIKGAGTLLLGKEVSPAMSPSRWSRQTAPDSGVHLTTQSLRQALAYYYEGDTPSAHRFRYALLAFDILTLVFIVGTSFLPRTTPLEWLDFLFGLVILADFTARLIISRNRIGELLHPSTWADADRHRLLPRSSGR